MLSQTNATTMTVKREINNRASLIECSLEIEIKITTNPIMAN